MEQVKFYFLILFYTLFAFACAPKPTLEVPEPYKKGQQYFHRVCSNCHGSDAMGKHTQAPRLIDEEFLANNFSDADIKETVLDGTGKMPSQKKNVTPEEITEIIKYLRYSQKAAGLEPEENEEDPA
ncbi:MAG: cytochrome C-552 [Nitrospinae bacterium CG22_combo_CG10-13_8_21_14_all_47_10]|nr:MAG: cytochrome C-552 [Nitrospinae bacterium CG22_combo_CG10-13_8_21_14_all_47_10]